MPLTSAARGALGRSPADGGPRRQPTILLVDDDKAYCRLLSLPFLLIGGYPGSTLSAVRSGAVTFLGKPFAIRALLTRMEMLRQTVACQE